MWGPIKTSTIFLLHSSQMVMSFTLIPTLSLSFFLSLPPTQISSGKKNKKKMKKTMAASVTRELEYFLMLAHEELWKLAQYYTKFAKVGSTFCQIRNKLSKICQRLVNSCQSGEILPNLVTLPTTIVDKKKIEIKRDNDRCGWKERRNLNTFNQQNRGWRMERIGWPNDVVSKFRKQVKKFWGQISAVFSSILLKFLSMITIENLFD